MSEERILLGQPKGPVPESGPKPGEPGYVPPVDAVPLPSKGKIYPLDSALFGADTIEIRSMTARDEDILSSRALIKSGRAISSLMQACVVNKAIDVDQLIAGDRNAIMISIRIAGYGADYDVDVICQNEECGKKYKYTVDLSKLEIRPLGEEPTSPGRNEFLFDLPVTRKRCLFKLLTGVDERELQVMQERTKKIMGSQANDAEVTGRLFFQVLQIGDEKDRKKLRPIVENLPAQDSRKLRGYIEKISPGVLMSQETTCPHCGTQEEVPVPFGTEFFWPKS